MAYSRARTTPAGSSIVPVRTGAGSPQAPMSRELMNRALQSAGSSRPASATAGSLHSLQVSAAPARTRTEAASLLVNGLPGQGTSTCSTDSAPKTSVGPSRVISTS